MKLIPAAGIRSVLTNLYKIFVGLTHYGLFPRMNDECYLKLLYRGVLGRPLHLDPPVLYSEKIQWLKLHDKNPIYPILCDKIAVREFVKERVGEQHLTDLYDTPEGIKFGELTLHSSSGLSQTMTQRGERFLGELLRLENVR